MKTAITAIATILLVTSTASFAYAEVPAWVKNNAGWWADGTISDTEFLTGIEFLIKDGIIAVPPTNVSSEASDGVPAWVKNNAGWWADGIISDGEFVNGIQHLMMTGLISVTFNEEPQQMTSESKNNDSKLAELEAELEKCSEIVKAYKRIDCQKPIEKAIKLHNYQTNAEKFVVGPIAYYWFGMNSEGNGFEISPTGQPILNIRMLAENTSSDSTHNVSASDSNTVGIVGLEAPFYSPNNFSAKAGQTISFDNIDANFHTVTSGNAASGPDGKFDSGLLSAGDKYTLTLDKPGEYDYFCTIHTNMVGTITVS